MLDVTVYSLPSSVCVKCRAVEISMRRKGIDAKKVRLDQEPDAMEFVRSLGYTEAPVIVVREDEKIVDHWGGYHEERIVALKEKVPA